MIVYARLVPAVTGEVSAVFTTDTSERTCTVVGCVALLFAKLGSAVEDETLAVLDISAVRDGFTPRTSCTLALPPFAIVPRFHATTPPDIVPPPVADTNEVPAGIGSLITTPLAPFGPRLVTESV